MSCCHRLPTGPVFVLIADCSTFLETQSVHQITCFCSILKYPHKDRVKHYVHITDSGQWQSLARWQPAPPSECRDPFLHQSTLPLPISIYLPGLGLLHAYRGCTMKCWQIGQNQHQAVRLPPLRRYLWNFDGKNAFDGAVVLWSALSLLRHVLALFALLNVTQLLNKIYNALSSSSPSSKGSLTEGSTQRRSCEAASCKACMISWYQNVSIRTSQSSEAHSSRYCQRDWADWKTAKSKMD